jgi:hypothetical protein
MNTIQQEAVINRTEATLAEYDLEVVRYDLQLLVCEPAVVQLLVAVTIIAAPGISFEIKVRIQCYLLYIAFISIEKILLALVDICRTISM